MACLQNEREETCFHLSFSMCSYVHDPGEAWDLTGRLGFAKSLTGRLCLIGNDTADKVGRRGAQRGHQVVQLLLRRGDRPVSTYSARSDGLAVGARPKQQGEGARRVTRHTLEGNIQVQNIRGAFRELSDILRHRRAGRVLQTPNRLGFIRMGLSLMAARGHPGVAVTGRRPGCGSAGAGPGVGVGQQVEARVWVSGCRRES